MLKAWLHNCEQQHDECKPRVGRLPKRLIDVGLQEEPARLGFSHDIHASSDSFVKYTTLSYYWGNAQFRTTIDNEETHLQKIPFNLLPRTLQDAIEITRRLGIKYIWIDALCIVQDDSAEWSLEASRMGDIYLGSSLTIVATDAVDASGGCFSKYSDAPSSSLLAITKSVGSETFLARIQPGDTLEHVYKSAISASGVSNPRGLHIPSSGSFGGSPNLSRVLRHWDALPPDPFLIVQC